MQLLVALIMLGVSVLFDQVTATMQQRYNRFCVEIL